MTSLKINTGFGCFFLYIDLAGSVNSICDNAYTVKVFITVSVTQNYYEYYY